MVSMAFPQMIVMIAADTMRWQEQQTYISEGQSEQYPADFICLQKSFVS
jgi:hypothetical protein